MSPENDQSDGFGYSRRKFIRDASVAGAGIVLASPLAGVAAPVKPDDGYTVKQIMDMFIKQVPGGPIPDTVDTLKSGSPDMKVTGIITTMFPTIGIINNAIGLGANFIIAHEPTFYNHRDETGWLQNDDVYQYKADLLKKNDITIWRCHDYIHHLVPDGVTTAVLKQLGWQQYADKTTSNVLTIQPLYLKEVVRHLKDKLSIDMVRYIGDPAQVCRHVVLMPGAAGGKAQIEAIEKYQPNLLICGEISEWETAEYVRDARSKGKSIALVVIGHIASEEPGSEYMLDWVKKNVPGIKAWHIPCGNSLSFM